MNTYVIMCGKIDYIVLLQNLVNKMAPIGIRKIHLVTEEKSYIFMVITTQYEYGVSH